MAIEPGSLRTDFLTHTLYLATPFQILYDVLESVVWFIFPNLENSDVAGILRFGPQLQLQPHPDSRRCALQCFQRHAIVIGIKQAIEL